MSQKKNHRKSKQSKRTTRPTKDAKPTISSAPPKRLRINAMDVFRAADRAAKKVLSEDALQVATVDGYENFMSRVGLHTDNLSADATYDFNLITRNRILLEAAYRGSWIVGVMIDAVADDMTRAGIDITTSDVADLRLLHRNYTKLQIWQSINDGLKWGRLYGGGIGFMQIEGQDPSTPLDISTVAKGQFKGLAIFDRWALNPVLSPVIQSGPNIGLPEFYQIVNDARSYDPEAPTATGQQTVHYSRCIRFTGIKLPYFQAITEMMWGESFLERLWDRLIAFDNASLSAGQLIDKANLRVVHIEGFRETLAAGGEAQAGLESSFDMMRRMQTNEGLTLLDKEDLFSSQTYTFSGLSDVLLQKLQELSGASGVPLIRIIGQLPAGLGGGDGQADLRMYYDNINAQQESGLRDPLDTLNKVMWRSTFGKPHPADLEFSFKPLWQMNDIDKATVTKSNTDSVTQALGSGLISVPTAMEELRDMSGSTGVFANITDEEIEEAKLEPPPMPDEEGPKGDDGKPLKPTPNPKEDDKKEPVETKDEKPQKWFKFWR